MQDARGGIGAIAAGAGGGPGWRPARPGTASASGRNALGPRHRHPARAAFYRLDRPLRRQHPVCQGSLASCRSPPVSASVVAFVATGLSSNLPQGSWGEVRASASGGGALPRPQRTGFSTRVQNRNDSTEYGRAHPPGLLSARPPRISPDADPDLRARMSTSPRQTRIPSPGAAFPGGAAGSGDEAGAAGQRPWAARRGRA